MCMDEIRKVVDGCMNKEWLVEHVQYRLSSDCDEMRFRPGFKWLGGTYVSYFAQLTEGARVVISHYIMANLMECDENELFKLAEMNTEALSQATVVPMADILSRMMGSSGNFDGLESSEDNSLVDFGFDSGEIPLYVVGNVHNTLGAAVVLYPGYAKKLWDQYGDSYLIPSSVHEWILVPRGRTFMEPEEVKEMIFAVSTDTVEERDRLSWHVFGLEKGEIGVIL